MLHVFHDVKVLAVDPVGQAVETERDAVDLIALGLEQGAAWVTVPVARLGERFFRLDTRVAGEVIQKFVNYRMKLAVVGDIAGPLARSKALRDFVYESNRSPHVWFVADLSELEARLAPA